MNYQKYNNALAIVIRTFARSATRNMQPIYLTKALAIINEKLGIPCCTEPNGVIDFGTMQKNNFTNAVQMIVNGMSPTYDQLTLRNARNLLIQLINDQCCVLTNSRYLNNGTGQYTAAPVEFTAPVVTGITPATLTLAPGATGTLSITFTSSTEDVDIQWFHNGTKIQGANEITFTIINASVEQAGTYSVEVTNIAGTTPGTNATVTVS